MAKSLRSKRIAELQARAKRSDILWMHRRNALHCLTGVQKLGEKTQLWCQRLIYAMREQYDDIEIQRELDELQARLDHQKELLKRRLSREEKEVQKQERKAESQTPSTSVLLPGAVDPMTV
jgi:hypothetical protein